MLLGVRQHLHRPATASACGSLYRNAVDPAPPWLAWTQPGPLCPAHDLPRACAGTDDFERLPSPVPLDCKAPTAPGSPCRRTSTTTPRCSTSGCCRAGAHKRLLVLRPGATGDMLYPLLGRRASLHEDAHRLHRRTTPPESLARDASCPTRSARHDVVSRATAAALLVRQPRPAEAPDRRGRCSERAGAFGLEHRHLDAAGRTRFSATRWLDFVMSGRATIGAESGSSVLDERGEITAPHQPAARRAAVPSRSRRWTRRCRRAGTRTRSSRSARAIWRPSTTKTAQVLVEGELQRRARAGDALHPGAPRLLESR